MPGAEARTRSDAGRGIRVDGIGPGAIVTPINRAWIEAPAKRAQVGTDGV